MAEGSVAADEADRLTVLRSYDILDTRPEDKFDVFTRTAAAMFDAPYAVISFVDRDRQWFKSRAGRKADALEPETPRAVSFCKEAIAKPDEVLVVNDTTRDPRFADNPFVTGAPGVRFYAGAPLRSPEGHGLGTLCIFDVKPRTLEPEKVQALSDLASGVSELLESRRAISSLQSGATTDPLTGLLNRSGWTLGVGREIERARLRGESCAVLLVRVARFKEISELHGHATGDALLIELARRLSRSMRRDDLVARSRGEEFTVLLPAPVEPADVRNVAARIVTALSAPCLVNGHRITASVNIGSASYPGDATDGPALLQKAETSLYFARRAGAGAHRSFRETSERERSVIEQIEQDLFAADMTEFVPYWQPYVALGTGAIVGHEALVRWNRPQGPQLMPSLFIPIAEATGFIEHIDRAVMSSACRIAAADPRVRRVSANVSGHWFSGAELPNMILGALRESGLDPAALEVEITESVLVADHAHARTILSQIKALGVSVVLDDFGAGYSSLVYLREFRFDKVKIDRSFIRDVANDRKSRAILEAVVQLAHALEMPVCAEGIETPEQLAVLEASGCDLAQGYLVGRPAATPLANGERPTRSFAREN
jgi:diguanylate cyclase (GGDEF)-like protein